MNTKLEGQLNCLFKDMPSYLGEIHKKILDSIILLLNYTYEDAIVLDLQRCLKDSELLKATFNYAKPKVLASFFKQQLTEEEINQHQASLVLLWFDGEYYGPDANRFEIFTNGVFYQIERLVNEKVLSLFTSINSNK